jgi:hypothetical protein
MTLSGETQKLQGLGLIEEHCLHCGKKVKINGIDPYYPPPEPEGIWLRDMDETLEIHTLGVLCFPCFEALNLDFGGFSAGGGVWPSIDAMLNDKPFSEVVKFPQFLNREEEYDEEEEDEYG